MVCMMQHNVLCLGGRDATHQGKLVKKENYTNDEFQTEDTPLSKVHECCTLRSTYPRVPQRLYPSELPDEVLGHHHHFTQLPRQEKVNQETGLSDGFYVTIHVITEFKNISREARGTRMERLQRMDIALGMEYLNKVDVGANTITKNWVGFIKHHL